MKKACSGILTLLLVFATMLTGLAATTDTTLSAMELVSCLTDAAYPLGNAAEVEVSVGSPCTSQAVFDGGVLSVYPSAADCADALALAKKQQIVYPAVFRVENVLVQLAQDDCAASLADALEALLQGKNVPSFAATKATPAPQMVWIPIHGGKKYHSKETCSNMKDPSCVTIDEAKQKGFTPCKKCKP